MNTPKTIDEITDIARSVFEALGSGHSEAVYQKAMEVGLRLKGLKFEAQKVIELKFEDHYVGSENLDILVEGNAQKVIIELKATQTDLGPPEEQQVRNYMRGLGIDLGLLINFPQPGRAKKDQGSRGIDPDVKPITLH